MLCVKALRKDFGVPAFCGKIWRRASGTRQVYQLAHTVFRLLNPVNHSWKVETNTPFLELERLPRPESLPTDPE